MNSPISQNIIDSIHHFLMLRNRYLMNPALKRSNHKTFMGPWRPMGPKGPMGPGPGFAPRANFGPGPGALQASRKDYCTPLDFIGTYTSHVLGGRGANKRKGYQLCH